MTANLVVTDERSDDPEPLSFNADRRRVSPKSAQWFSEKAEAAQEAR